MNSYAFRGKGVILDEIIYTTPNANANADAACNYGVKYGASSQFLYKWIILESFTLMIEINVRSDTTLAKYADP